MDRTPDEIGDELTAAFDAALTEACSMSSRANRAAATVIPGKARQNAAASAAREIAATVFVS